MIPAMLAMSSVHLIVAAKPIVMIISVIAINMIGKAIVNLLYLINITRSTKIIARINIKKTFFAKASPSLGETVFTLSRFILTGSFVDWDGSYGEAKNYSMLPIGIPKIKLFGELSRGAKKVEVKFTDR